MRLLQVAAVPYVGGHGVELRWTIPAKAYNANRAWRVHVRRDVRTFPDTPQAGTLVVASLDAQMTVDGEGNAHFSCLDAPLRGETVYYYSFFPTLPSSEHAGDSFELDRYHRASTRTTTRYALAEYLYELLPALYHRYDTQLPPAFTPDPNRADMPEHLREAGQLRRFLEIFGAQFDQLYSQIRTLSTLYDVDKIDGTLLPLLGEWIGWRFDARQRVDRQRNELHFAPHIYQTVGIVPTVESTVKRVTGWEARVKEYVHNILLTNAPEQLIVRALTRTGTGTWVKPVMPVTHDAAYGGPLAIACDDLDQRWLFYETLQGGRWEIWGKHLPAAGEWRASQVVRRGRLAYRHPTVAFWQGKLYLFWDAYDAAQGTWQIEYRTGEITGEITQDGAGQIVWSAAKVFGVGDGGNAEGADNVARSHPVVLVEAEAGDPTQAHLWLFWRERQPDQAAWVTRYARFTQDEAGQTLQPPAITDANTMAMAVSDLMPVLRQTAAGAELWLAWTRRAAPDSHVTEIGFAKKRTLDPDQTDWIAVGTLPKPAPATISDREPYLLVSAAGDFELFWSSNQDGSKSIWRATCTPTSSPLNNTIPNPLTWSAREQVTDGPFTQRHPLAFVKRGQTVLLYRDNASLMHSSNVYTATKTLDLRYAGSTTVDTRNRAKQALWNRYEDFQTYLHGRSQLSQRVPATPYQRDTIAIFLTPNTIDPNLLDRGRHLIESALRQFLPIQVQVELRIEQDAHNELVYSYTFGDAPPPWLTPEEQAAYVPRVIGEAVVDQLPEMIPRVRDDAVDFVPGWVWLRTWRSGASPSLLVDTRTVPIDTHFRTLHRGLVEES